MPKPVKAVYVYVFNIPHGTFTHYLLIPTSILTEAKMIKDCRKGNLALSWTNRCYIYKTWIFILSVVKTVALQGTPELGKRECSLVCTHTQAQEAYSPTHPSEEWGRLESLRNSGPVLRVASCTGGSIGRWNQHETYSVVLGLQLSNRVNFCKTFISFSFNFSSCLCLRTWHLSGPF